MVPTRPDRGTMAARRSSPQRGSASGGLTGAEIHRLHIASTAVKEYDWTLCSGGPGDASVGPGRAWGRLLRPARGRDDF